MKTLKQLEAELKEKGSQGFFGGHFRNDDVDWEAVGSFLRSSYTALLEGAIGEMKALVKHTPEEVARLNRDLPSRIQEQAQWETMGYMKCLSDVEEIIRKRLE